MKTINLSLCTWSLQNSQIVSEYSYFYGNMFICISSISICSLCKRIQLEKALTGMPYLREMCIYSSMTTQL